MKTPPRAVALWLALVASACGSGPAATPSFESSEDALGAALILTAADAQRGGCEEKAGAVCRSFATAQDVYFTPAGLPTGKYTFATGRVRKKADVDHGVVEGADYSKPSAVVSVEKGVVTAFAGLNQLGKGLDGGAIIQVIPGQRARPSGMYSLRVCDDAGTCISSLFHLGQPPVCAAPGTTADLCGPFFDTYVVIARDGREGIGLRCLSRDHRAFYGEGWWDDELSGPYRHLGSFQGSVALTTIDLGWTYSAASPRCPDGDDVFETGAHGAQPASVTPWRAGNDQGFDVTYASGASEEWSLVLKNLPFPACYAPLPWNGDCGKLGLRAVRQLVAGKRRCLLIPSATPHTFIQDLAAPDAWLGEGYLDSPIQTDANRAAQHAQTHLAWRRPDGTYAAADLCQPGDSGCRSLSGVRLSKVPASDPDIGVALSEDYRVDGFPGPPFVFGGFSGVLFDWFSEGSLPPPPPACPPCGCR